MTSRLNTGFLVSTVALDGIRGTLQPMFRLCSDLWSGWEQLQTVRSSTSLNQCGRVAASCFLVIPRANLRTFPEQVHTKTLLLFGKLFVSSFLLEVFVFQSALFMQLENFNEGTWKPHLLRPRNMQQTDFLDSELSHVARKEPAKAIRFIWNFRVYFVPHPLELFESLDVLNDWQTLNATRRWQDVI